MNYPVVDEDEQPDDLQDQEVNGFRLPTPRTADVNAGRGIPMSGSPRPNSDDLISQAMSSNPMGQQSSPMVRIKPSPQRAAVRSTPAHATIHPVVADALRSGSIAAPATPVEGTHIPGLTPTGGDDAVKQAMMASATKMPQAPPHDDQLDSMVQDRYQSGQTLNRQDPKYRMGFKGRLLGSLANFASGVAGKGVAVDVGPGAMNSRYYNDKIDQIDRTHNLDVAIANREKLNEENRKGFDSATKQAFESQVASARQDTAKARQGTADAQQQTADVKQQLADQQGRDITYDPKTKRFMRGGKIYLPKTIEEGASLEAGNGVQGYYSKMWSQERKNNNNSLGDELARERMEEQRQKNLSGVQKDIDSAVTRHKAGLQSRMKALQDKLDLGEIDQKSFNDGMANIERDDYKGMAALGKQFSSRSKRFGETVEPPKPEPWENSFLSDDERARLMGGATTSNGGNGPKAPQQARISSPAKSGKDMGPAPQGSKEGRTGTLPDGTKVVVRGGRIVSQ